MRILFAAAGDILAQALIASLERHGHQVIPVSDGHLVADTCLAQAPDLILLDAALTGRNGRPVVRDIRATTGAPWIPLLLMSDQPTTEDIVAGFDVGADDVLIKPIVADVLAARVRSLQRSVSLPRHLYSMLDSVPEAILTVGETGLIVSINKAGLRMFSYLATEIVGQAAQRLLPQLAALASIAGKHPLPSDVSTSLSFTGQSEGVRKNGERFPIRLALTEAEPSASYRFILVIGEVSGDDEARARARESSLEIESSARLLKAITNAMPDMVSYWDKGLRCRFANPSNPRGFGHRHVEIVGSTLRDVLGEPLYKLNEPYIHNALAGDTQHFEFSRILPDGTMGYIWMHYIPDRDANDNVVGLFVQVTDITPLRRTGHGTVEAGTRQYSVEGVMVTDDAGYILSVNPAFSEITGYSAAEAIGQTPRILKSGYHGDPFFAGLWHALLTEGQWQGEIWNRHKDGTLCLEWQTISRIPLPPGEPCRFVAVFHDITQLRMNEQRLRHLAFHDALTDLPNRFLLQERLALLLASAERAPRLIAVLFLDLDRFKLVNDRLGHACGDELLKRVAGRLQTLVRQSDTVARLGGDEFVVLLEAPADADDVARIASRILAIVNEPMELRGQSAHVGVSIGIALYPKDGTTADLLIRNADTAMYAAKAEGKNLYRFFGAGEQPR